MSVKLGDLDINKIYLGDTEIKKAYLGDVLIYDKTGGGGFSPIDVADCSLFIDPSDVSTITLNGSNVSQITDKSVYGDDHSQAVATLQPLYDAVGKNMEFDGVDDVLRGTNTRGSFSELTVFFAIEDLNTTTDDVHFNLGGSTANEGRCLYWRRSSGDSFYVGGNILATGGHTTGKTCIKLINSAIDDIQEVYWNKTLKNSEPSDAAQSAGTSPSALGAGSSTSRPSNVKIYGILVYDRHITAQEQSDIETWISTNWGC